MNLADNLKRIRKENDLSQEQLAEKLGVSRQAVSKWESGHAYPEMDKVLQLCKIFDLNIDDLLNQNIKEVNDNKQNKININKYIDDFLEYVTKTVDMFSNMRLKEKLKCIFEQFIIFVMLLIMFIIIGTIGSGVVRGLLDLLPDNIFYIVFNIIESIYLLICLILGIILILHIFKIRYLDYYIIVKDDDESIQRKNNTNEYSSDELTKEKHNIENIGNDKIYLEKKREKIIIRDPNHSGYKFISGLLKCILFLLKIIACCWLVVFCLLFIVFVILAILSFLFIKTGILFIGSLLMVTACIGINLIILNILYSFVISKKLKVRNLAIGVIIFLIAIGMGTGFIMIGISKFDYINNISKMDNVINTETIISMKDDLVIYGDNIEYIENESQDVKIVFSHSKFYEVKLYNDYKNIHYIHWYQNDDFISSLIQTYIKDINNFKIIDYSNFKTTIYTSKENIDKLKYNLKEYIIFEEKQNNYDEYEEEINELNSIIENQEIEISNLENQLENALYYND